MSSPAPAAPSSHSAVIPAWSFADRLRKIRRDVLGNISQGEFAERLGVKANAYSAWESDRARPRDLVPLARRIELLTGVPAAWILGVDQPATVRHADDTPTLEGQITRQFRCSVRGSSGDLGGTGRLVTSFLDRRATQLAAAAEPDSVTTAPSPGQGSRPDRRSGGSSYRVNVAG